MLDLLLQIFGLILLFGGLWLGYRRWIAPRQTALDFQSRGLLLLIIMTLIGGFIGSPFWWAGEARAFSWTLPPLASRMLASAGWSFVVVGWLALERPTLRRTRLVLLLLAVYLGPLAVAAILFHLNRFNPGAPITYVFFIIVGVMTVGAIWYLLRQPTILSDGAQDTAPSSSTVRGWLGLVAVITGLWGLALFVTDNGPSDLIWVWSGDLLTSRLIGVMLLAIAVGAATSLAYRDVARMMLAMITVYGVGLALASLWNALGGKPIKPSYVVVFGIIAVISAVLWAMDRRGMPQTAPAASG